MIGPFQETFNILHFVDTSVLEFGYGPLQHVYRIIQKGYRITAFGDLLHSPVQCMGIFMGRSHGSIVQGFGK